MWLDLRARPPSAEPNLQITMARLSRSLKFTRPNARLCLTLRQAIASQRWAHATRLHLSLRVRTSLLCLAPTVPPLSMASRYSSRKTVIPMSQFMCRPLAKQSPILLQSGDVMCHPMTHHLPPSTFRRILAAHQEASKLRRLDLPRTMLPRAVLNPKSRRVTQILYPGPSLRPVSVVTQATRSHLHKHRLLPTPLRSQVNAIHSPQSHALAVFLSPRSLAITQPNPRATCLPTVMLWRPQAATRVWDPPPRRTSRPTPMRIANPNRITPVEVSYNKLPRIRLENTTDRFLGETAHVPDDRHATGTPNRRSTLASGRSASNSHAPRNAPRPTTPSDIDGEADHASIEEEGDAEEVPHNQGPPTNPRMAVVSYIDCTLLPFTDSLFSFIITRLPSTHLPRLPTTQSGCSDSGTRQRALPMGLMIGHLVILARRCPRTNALPREFGLLPPTSCTTPSHFWKSTLNTWV